MSPIGLPYLQPTPLYSRERKKKEGNQNGIKPTLGK